MTFRLRIDSPFFFTLAYYLFIFLSFLFTEVGVRDDVSDRLRSLVLALPPENCTTLKYLMAFLAKVGANHEKNYMNNKYVLVPCFTQTIFSQPIDSQKMFTW